MLLDTTFRPILLGIERTVQIVNGKFSNTVSSEAFAQYEKFLETMAAFSRAIYCDSGVLFQVLPSIGTLSNKDINTQITQLDAKAPRRSPSTSPNSKEGRPMLSYIVPETSRSGTPFATYISSVSDMTCLVYSNPPLPGASTNDVLLVFKGSSTVKNFKHDVMTLSARDTLQNLAKQVGIQIDPSVPDINVPSSFVLPLLKNWNILMRYLKKGGRIFLTGHSLGGAFATMFGYLLAESHISPVHIVTFGAPALMGDGGRNRFNEHLDQGRVTLDRVVCNGDPIPLLPPRYSHPGFRPLATEWNSPRPVQLKTVKKMYHLGGANVRKQRYEKETLSHIPNLITVPTDVPYFPHAGYLGMTFLGAFRLYGMKNPGFKGSDGSWNTFVADFLPDGIQFRYEKGSPEPVAADADKSENGIESLVITGGRRKTRRRHRR
jgi:hypothetical protein